MNEKLVMNMEYTYHLAVIDARTEFQPVIAYNIFGKTKKDMYLSKFQSKIKPFSHCATSFELFGMIMLVADTTTWILSVVLPVTVRNVLGRSCCNAAHKTSPLFLLPMEAPLSNNGRIALP